MANAINGLIGQANLKVAHGKTDEALSLLFEEPKNAELYFQVSNIYSDMDRIDKCFEYRHLGANLTSRTSASEWSEVGMMAMTLERIEDAGSCFDKAIRAEPTNWAHYERRIEIHEAMGLDHNAMKTKLKAIRQVDCASSQLSYDFLRSLIKEVAEFFITANDEERAMEALEASILRNTEFGEMPYEQHITLLGMWMVRGRYNECVKSILALNEDLRPLSETGEVMIKTCFSPLGCVVEPYPLPEGIHSWNVENTLRASYLAHLIICFIRLDRKEIVPGLIEKLMQRNIQVDDESTVLDIAKAYQEMDALPDAQQFVEKLLGMSIFECNADAWYLYGTCLQSSEKIEAAKEAYERVITLQPDYVDARINLSGILQSMGQLDEALDTLKDYDLESCSQLPDERLLVRLAGMLTQHGRTEQYRKCVRLLLIPHFYVSYKQMTTVNTRTRSSKRNNVTNALKRCAFQAVEGTHFERMVKRLGGVCALEERPTNDLTGDQLHDYALKLAEGLHESGNYTEMLYVVCYSYIDQKISETGMTTFSNLLLYASLKAKSFALSFEFVRGMYNSMAFQGKVPDEDDTAKQLKLSRLFNGMNYVLCNHQNVAYHRFVMRALAKSPENYPLHMISGNNSLVTGSYRHALGEYFTVWLHNKKDPLACLLIALTFTHMACKKDITSRQCLSVKALAFMKRYQDLRGFDDAEVNYNIGRLLHQMGILHKAIYYYKRVLEEIEVPVLRRECPDTGEVHYEPSESYNLKPLAAYNLSMIYDSSGNRALARSVLESHCVF